MGLGLVFLMHGANARPLWFDASGITPLTARLFASPLTGLGLGLILVARAKDWRAVLVPAVGMATIGILGTLSLVSRPRRLRAAKRRCMANGGNAAIAASDWAYASDFQAVAIRWNTARLAALSRGNQPLRRARLPVHSYFNGGRACGAE